ncbi:hypothetical protein EYC84_011337 [Monilinia fructicola]|uniref:6-phosphofructo-2-kinase domain-containing protein n=1 Tax=Monilinia fructicola TaxID=38448 RepID=A0A5M9J807_MONFR|nr:hypothetical protein EYC84_011337 [Monilinia fructicola]
MIATGQSERQREKEREKEKEEKKVVCLQKLEHQNTECLAMESPRELVTLSLTLPSQVDLQLLKAVQESFQFDKILAPPPPRVRAPATTLNIPGMTRSRVSPDGKIAQRDVASKLVVIMVGLPARGKSYITKKIQRYLSWQQHETRIFNVGNRRRVAAGKPQQKNATPPTAQTEAPTHRSSLQSQPIRTGSIPGIIDAPTQAAHMILNGVDPTQQEQETKGLDLKKVSSPGELPDPETMDQSASFFNPLNSKAALIREQVAMATLDELLDFLLLKNGAVGILDATNSTIERRSLLFKHVKEREPKLGILFIESVCEDESLLEANMRLKLRGPDYKDKDPESSLRDFKKRVEAYESAYVPLGKYEEDNHMQYIKMIDVGRKVVHYQLKGFLTGGIASYLSTFNLSPRQIWITRHGKSKDNAIGKLGGDSDLTEEGQKYAQVLHNFITDSRRRWLLEQQQSAIESAKYPPGGEAVRTPPYPDIMGELDEKNFCVWTSMLNRSIQTAEVFEQDEDYDVKNWEMLNELNAGSFEGLTYKEIESRFPDEYEKRARDKLHYIYPGVGGEGYLQVISRLRDMVRELERITDHVLIIGHRSVARVLMAYFMDLTRDDIADLDVPLGMLYAIEPKPYGIEFHAYKYNERQEWLKYLHTRGHLHKFGVGDLNWGKARFVTTTGIFKLGLGNQKCECGCGCGCGYLWDEHKNMGKYDQSMQRIFSTPYDKMR